MTDVQRLAILKQDLQLLTNANDDYLMTLILAAKNAIQTEGITLTEGNVLVDTAIVQYAAYLFRKRASEETIMPRFLRYQLNQLLFSQKVGGEA